MIATVKEGLEAEGVRVPMTKLCRWFDVPRRTVYYQPTKAAPKVHERFEAPIKAMIEQEPSLGYRTVASLLGLTKTLCSGSSCCAAGSLKSAWLGLGPG